MKKPRATILLVEDDEHDAFFLERALQKARPDLTVQLVTDGQEALAFFNGHLNSAGRPANPLPSFIFLDLKLPYFGGFEILERLRSKPSLDAIPVFILTSSSEERDRQRAKALGAKGYLVKPPTPQMLLEVLGPAPSGRSRKSRPASAR